jgi:acyl-CoA synthetase (AMP-forming)/AMP-acid ligase II
VIKHAPTLDTVDHHPVVRQNFAHSQCAIVEAWQTSQRTRQNFGDRLAVIDDRPNGDHFRSPTVELDLFTNQLGHLLVSHGVNPGDRVVWCGQNSIGVVSLMSAARKVGATAVPLNYRLSDDEAAYVIDHCDAEIVYVDADFAPMLERVRGSIPKIREVLVFDGAPPSDDAWFVSVDAEVGRCLTLLHLNPRLRPQMAPR